MAAFIPNPGLGVWRAITTAPKKEQYVIDQLKPYGCEIYRPMREKTRKVNGKGRTQRVTVPVFPTLLFVRPLCTLLPPFRTFRGINSAYALGMSDGEMTRFRRALRKVAIPDNNQEVDGVSRFNVGDEIEMENGPWEGVIREIDDQKRVVLLCTLFGREVKIALSPDQVRRKLS